jgi:hypothetical protein
MRGYGRTWGQRAVFLLLLGAAVIFFAPRIAAVLSSGAGLALSALSLLAYIFMIVALPLMLFSLLKFAYSVFARPYLRLWRLRRFRNTRYLREAVRRGR